MSDIVERLRRRPQREMLYLDGCIAAGYGPTVESQAADEIECLRSRLAGMEAAWRNACERGDRAVARLAEADALLLMTKWSVLCVAEDAYRAHRLDISDSQYALLNRIDAFRAADSASWEGEK